MIEKVKQFIPYGKIQTFIENVRSSIWLVPAVFILSFMTLSEVLLVIDRTYFEQITRSAPWLFSGTPDAARNLLSSIASSLITVISIAFSITIIALQQASTQYSPRVLRTFTSDRKNQIVLGMYTATFTYSLLILRAVRSPDGAIDTGFVPALSVSIALLFALICIGLLIFFIHQVSSSLQVSEIIRHVHRDLIKEIDDLFPKKVGKDIHEPTTAEDVMKSLRKRPSKAVKSRRAGFVRLIDQEALSRIHVKGSKWLYVHPKIGSFVKKGDVLAEIDARKLSSETENKVINAITINNQRSTTQDALFGIMQLVDITLRALSPSVNDPRTAMYCLYYLSDSLCRLATRQFPKSTRTFDNNTMTFVLAKPSWDTFVLTTFNQIRRETSDSFRVSIALVDALIEIVDCIPEKSTRIEPVLLQVRGIEETAEKRAITKDDRKLLKEKIRLLKKHLRNNHS